MLLVKNQVKVKERQIKFEFSGEPFTFLPSLCFSDAAVSTPASFSHLLSASNPRKSHVLVLPAPRASDQAVATA